MSYQPKNQQFTTFLSVSKETANLTPKHEGRAVRRLTSSATWNLHTRFFFRYFFTTISRDEKEFTFSYPLLAQFLDFSLFSFSLRLLLVSSSIASLKSLSLFLTFVLLRCEKSCVLWEKKGKFKKKNHEALWTVEDDFFLSFCLNGF